MFLVELIESNAGYESNVLALLNLIKKRYENEQAFGKPFNTASFLKLARNVGMNLDYDGFVDLFNGSDSLKNIIDNFNQKTLTFKTSSSDDEVDSPDKKRKGQDIVGKMASKAVDI